MTTNTLQTNPNSKSNLLIVADRSLSIIENLLNKLAAFTIFAVMLATVVQIATRIAGFPVPGFLELSEQSIAVFAFLGAAYGQRLGAHIRMELLVGAVVGRARWIMEVLSTLIAMGVIGVLIFYSYGFFLDAYVIGDSTLDYGFPTWPSKLLVPCAFTVWFLRLTLELIGFARLALNPALEPIAVPIIKSAAEVAKEEATETFGRDVEDISDQGHSRKEG